ncbi:hypothetical protein EAE96_010629 [Botrytis aclada]|nr:hypothetical protein EAE96_010629 [Botrytis aclada]
MLRPCPPNLDRRERKHWYHQRNFYVKLAGLQDEWVGFSNDEAESGEGSEDESQEQESDGFSDEIVDEPIEIPRIKRRRTAKDTSSEVEDADEATRHHMLTNDLGFQSSHVVKPVVPPLGRDSRHNRKLRRRLSPPTAILTRYTKASTSETTSSETTERSNSISHHAVPPNPSRSNARHSSAEKASSKNASTQTTLSYSSAGSILLEEADQISSEGGVEGLLSISHNGMQHSNSRLVSRHLSNQDSGLHTSPNVAHLNPMLVTAFPSSSIDSCAMRAASFSRIAPAKQKTFFPALGQHSPADVFAVTSPTRASLIDSSISVAASSTGIGGVALDGHLGSKCPAEVQFVNSMPVTALQVPIGRPTVASNALTQVAPHLLAGDNIVDVENLRRSILLGTIMVRVLNCLSYKKFVYAI